MVRARRGARSPGRHAGGHLGRDDAERVRAADPARPARAVLPRRALRALAHRLSVGRRSGRARAQVPERVRRHRLVPAAALAARAGRSRAERQGRVRHQLPDRRPRGRRPRSSSSWHRPAGCSTAPRTVSSRVWSRDDRPKSHRQGVQHPAPAARGRRTTTSFPRARSTFGVEYRDVDPESLRATYAGNAEQLAELEARSPEGGFFDAGVSIHVCGADDGYEYLRFDCFDDEPHYHYVHRTTRRHRS